DHPRTGPHFRRPRRIFGCREPAYVTPPGRHVDRHPHVVDVHYHRGRVLSLSGTPVNRGHAEADTLAALEAVRQDAMRRQRGRVVEARDVSPDYELALRMSRLRRWWRRRFAASACGATRRGRRRL